MSLFKKKAPVIQEEPVIDTTGLSEEEIAKLNAEAVLAKYDKESSFRNRLPKNLELIVTLVLIAFSLFQLWTSMVPIPAQLLRSYHVAFVLALVFLLYPAKQGMRKDIIPWYDWLLAFAALAAVLYIPANFKYLVSIQGIYNLRETIIGIAGMLLLMEACRRVVGLPILIIVSIFLLYTLYGHVIPLNNILHHRQISLGRAINHMFFTTEGIFGTPIGVSATFIFLFILFGAFLEKTGVGRMFIDLANAVAGKRIGGPAKVAVISSALQGTVSGSSVANTVGTGSFTIPAMKRLGYKPEFAGAVEAAASTGGQIMPPIMGAAAFLMAEITGNTYGRIVLSAVIPAILYFSGIFMSVHHEARKLGLVGMDASEVPVLKTIIKERGHLLIPLAFMIYLLSSRLTPTYAALGAILTSLIAHSIGYWSLLPVAFMIVGLNTGLAISYCALGAIGIWLVVCAIRRNLGFELREIPEALSSGARSVIAVAVACAMAGMIVGTVTMTGLGLKFANALAMLAGDNIFLMMFFTMIASILLGMGVPTTANYLITSTICSRAIIELLMVRNGVSAPTMAIIISAHMFVFYFGIIADITPPVALAAMAGSAIAKGDPFKTGVTATRLAIGAFIVPYIFVLNPAMLLIDVDIPEVLLNVTTALLGMYSVSGGLAGFLQDDNYWYESLLLTGGGLCMIIPGWKSDLVGLVILVGIIALQKLRSKKHGRRRPELANK